MDIVALFISVFVMIFLAEMGDKTQLLVMSLASKYKIHTVLIGVFISICFLNTCAVFIGGIITEILPMEFISIIAGASFLIFAVSGLKDNLRGDKVKNSKMPPVLAVFLIFFLAELGDKTQISVMALSATQDRHTIPVLLGAVLGMFLSDSLGIILLKLFKINIQNKRLKLLSVIIFAVFGIFTIYRPLVFYFGNPAGITISVFVSVIMGLIFSYSILKQITPKKI